MSAMTHAADKGPASPPHSTSTASTTAPTYTAFAGSRLIASGGLAEVLPVLKRRFDEDEGELVLVFEDETGRQVDFDLRGTLDEVLGREGAGPVRSPGRPRLGVVSREVSLLPRQWEWLEQQPQGISAALRALIDQARKSESGAAKAKRMRSALSRFLSSMAGDRPKYEDACRALFAGEQERFEALVERWPKDIRDHAIRRAREASRAEASATNT